MLTSFAFTAARPRKIEISVNKDDYSILQTPSNLSQFYYLRDLLNNRIILPRARFPKRMLYIAQALLSAYFTKRSLC